MPSHAAVEHEEELEVVCRAPGAHEKVNVFGLLVYHPACRRGSLSCGRHDTYLRDIYHCPCPYLCLSRVLYPCPCRRRTSICQIFGYCAWLAMVTAVKSGEKALPSY